MGDIIPQARVPAFISLSLLPDYGCNVTSWFKLLPSCPFHHGRLPSNQINHSILKLLLSCSLSQQWDLESVARGCMFSWSRNNSEFPVPCLTLQPFLHTQASLSPVKVTGPFKRRLQRLLEPTNDQSGGHPSCFLSSDGRKHHKPPIHGTKGGLFCWY